MNEDKLYKIVLYTEKKLGRLGRKIAYGIMFHEKDVFHSTLYRRFLKEKFKIELGLGSYGVDPSIFDGPAVIGKYVSIAPNVRRLCVNHLIDGVTTHPCCFNPIYKWVQKDTREYTKINIENDVWIGANVTILPNVKNIGNGSIVAAGAVVTRDIPPYEIWGGGTSKIHKKKI